MNTFNKQELRGIFGGIAVMVLVLAFFRFDGAHIFSQTDTGNQGAVVVVGADEDVANALVDNSGVNGLAKLIIDDIEIGSGTHEVEDGDTVTVEYIGTTQDGVRFSDSYTSGEPLTFTVGDGKVIEGWDEGIIGMRVGGKRVIVVPAAMAYGNKRVGPIPPNSPLVFSLELLSVK